MSVAEREAVLARFQAGAVAVVVCTDAAARGIDVTDVGHVVQVGIYTSPGFSKSVTL